MQPVYIECATVPGMDGSSSGDSPQSLRRSLVSAVLRCTLRYALTLVYRSRLMIDEAKHPTGASRRYAMRQPSSSQPGPPITSTRHTLIAVLQYVVLSALITVLTHLFCVAEHDNGLQDLTFSKLLVLEHAHLACTACPGKGCTLNGD